MKKVMIVEDEPAILESTTLALEMNDFEVLAIANASNIFDDIKNFEPDIVLLDFNMGDYNGRKICDQIKADPGSKNTKVILFTAAVDGDDQFKNPLFSNFDGYVSKPYDIDDLINKLAH